jgi:uncharacterized protein YjbJ (UPF0337 family)
MLPGAFRMPGALRRLAGQATDSEEGRFTGQIPHRGVKEPVMAAEDKAANKVTEVKGKAKKETGKAIGNEQMEAEGRTDQAKGNLKQAGEKVKDAFKK